VIALIKMKVYRTGKDILVAACDSHLIGQKFKEGELRLEVSAFYDGLEVEKQEFLRQLKLATIGNFVGEEVVKITIEEGFVDKNCVIEIDGVPHAQMVLM